MSREHDKCHMKVFSKQQDQRHPRNFPHKGTEQHRHRFISFCELISLLFAVSLSSLFPSIQTRDLACAQDGKDLADRSENKNRLLQTQSRALDSEIILQVKVDQ